MLINNTKKIIALGLSLATITGAIPVIISPIPVFASQKEGEETTYDKAEGGQAASDTTCTTSTSVKVSNSIDEIDTIANLNSTSDTEGSSAQKYVTISGIKFQLTDPIRKHVSVVGQSLEANTNLVLPSKIQWNNETFTVTSIGERTFENCNRLTSIVIPSSIENIGNYAFLLCSKLENIEIQTSVTKIEDYAFLACNWKANYIVHNKEIKKYLLGCKSRIKDFQITVVTIDKSKLEKLYDTYKETSPGNYTYESFKEFTDALNYAKNVLDKKTADAQTEVDNAKKTLQEAINGLKEKVAVTGITVIGVDSISQSGGSTNLTVSVNPDDATNKNVTWNIVSGKNLASITQDGTLIASESGNGSIIVKATSKDGSNVFGEKTINIATYTSGLKNLYDDNEEKLKGNYINESFSIFTKALDNAKTVLNKTDPAQTEVDNAKKALQEAINGLKEKVAVTGITVIGVDSINQSGGSTNLTASITPDDATNKNVTWSIVSGNNLASITQDGTLTVSKSGNGSVTVKATANDESGIYEHKLITIDNSGLYIITASAGVNGTITPHGISSIAENDDLTYNIIPNLGYEINDVTVDAVRVGAVNSYTFEKITTEHTISATFKVKNSTSSSNSSSKSKSSKLVVNSIDEAKIIDLNTKNINTVIVNGNWYYLDNIYEYMKIYWIISSSFLY